VATRTLALAATAGALLVLGGCATPPQTRYAWGSYEELIYAAEAKPGTFAPEAQVEQLEKDREAARAAQKPLPPGWHAQLGYLYFQLGHGDLARDELVAEKTQFPEATALVDRLLSNLAAGAGQQP
jgi:hypothetical protein